MKAGKKTEKRFKTIRENRRNWFCLIKKNKKEGQKTFKTTILLCYDKEDATQ